MDRRSIIQIGILLALLFVFKEVESGLEGLNCDAPRNLVNGTFLPSAVAPCDTDCKTNHGAASGSCEDNFDCICAYPGPPPTTASVQCVNNSPFYTKVCEYDCKCNHNAATGECNFQTEFHPCTCIYSNEGQNKCPDGINCGFNVFNILLYVLTNPLAYIYYVVLGNDPDKLIKEYVVCPS